MSEEEGKQALDQQSVDLEYEKQEIHQEYIRKNSYHDDIE